MDTFSHRSVLESCEFITNGSLGKHRLFLITWGTNQMQESLFSNIVLWKNMFWTIWLFWRKRNCHLRLFPVCYVVKNIYLRALYCLQSYINHFSVWGQIYEWINHIYATYPLECELSVMFVNRKLINKDKCFYYFVHPKDIMLYNILQYSCFLQHLKLHPPNDFIIM